MFVPPSKSYGIRFFVPCKRTKVHINDTKMIGVFHFGRGKGRVMWETTGVEYGRGVWN